LCDDQRASRAHFNDAGNLPAPQKTIQHAFAISDSQLSAGAATLAIEFGARLTF
jgi:hypothetical protein